MNIKNILLYQEEERKLRKLTKELKESPEAKEVFKQRNLNAESLEEVKKHDNAVAVKINELEKSEAIVSVYQREYEEILSGLNGVDEVKQLEFFEKKLKDLLNKIEAVYKEIERSQRDVLIAVNLAKTAHDKVITSGKKYHIANSRFTELKNSKQNEADIINSKMKSLRDECDPEMMKIYDKVRAAKQFPVFVKVNGNSCGGCSLEFIQDTAVKLDSQGYVECPNCGRIIFKNEEK